jgi:hypothetical protein
MSFARQAYAWSNLAYRFFVHVLRMPLRPFRHEARRFLAAVEPEGFLPLSAGARAHMPQSMACINCGLCALAAQAGAQASFSAWEEPWTFVVGASRALDHGALLAASTPRSARMEAVWLVCPQGVPISSLASLGEQLVEAPSRKSNEPR